MCFPPFQSLSAQPIVSQDDEQPKSINFGHLAAALRPTNQRLSFDQDAEGRRRLSSNFFDILTDAQRYDEVVQQFVNENCEDEDEDFVAEVQRPEPKILDL